MFPNHYCNTVKKCYISFQMSALAETVKYIIKDPPPQDVSDTFPKSTKCYVLIFSPFLNLLLDFSQQVIIIVMSVRQLVSQSVRLCTINLSVPKIKFCIVLHCIFLFVLYYCIVSLYCIIVLYYCIVSLYCIIVLYYCIVLLYCVIVMHYCIVLLCCILYSIFCYILYCTVCLYCIYVLYFLYYIFVSLYFLYLCFVFFYFFVF